MWRSTERASLEKKPSTRLTGAVLGGEDKGEAAFRLGGEPSLSLLGDVRRMIVEDQLDRRMARIGGVEELEELNDSRLRWRSLTRAWTWPVSRSMPASRLDRAVALVLVVAPEGRMPAGLGRQVRGGDGDS